MVRSQYLLAWKAQFHDKNYGKSLLHYLEALRYSSMGEYKEQNHDVHGIKNSIGWLYQTFGDFNTALKYYQECLDIATSLEDNKLVLKSLNSLRAFHANQDDYDNALSIILDIQKLNRSVGDKVIEIDALNNKGNAFKELGRLDEAIKTHKELLKIVENYGDPENQLTTKAMAMTNLGECYFLKGEYDLSLSYYQQGLGLKDSIGNYPAVEPRSYFYSLQALAETYDKLGDPLAEQAYLNAHNFLTSFGGTSDKIYPEFYEKFANFYEEKHNYEKASFYRKIHGEILKKHWEKQQELEMIDKQYNLELITQRYFSLLQQKERNEQVQYYSTLGIIGIFLIFLVILSQGAYKRYRTKRELEESIRAIQES